MTKKLILIVVSSVILILLAPIIFLGLSLFIHQDKNVNAKVVMVLGAGIINNTLPTQVLEKRLEKAIELYRDGKVTQIIVSGDNSDVDHNEPKVMRDYLINKKIPSVAIIQDFGGRRTIDSCWRAKNVFKVTQMYVVTQGFHLNRATFLCERQGLGVIPVIADDATLGVKIDGYIREIPASWVAIWESYTQYTPEIQGNGKEQIVN